ncbi:MAG: hypothetical protein IKB42_01040 [Clostridia bacterium]|nr:hypothetical protein [Clostridia bacterium]
MSKNILKYKDTKLYRIRKKNKFFIFILCVSMIVGVIYLSTILGSAIKVGNFNFLFGKNKNSIAKHSYYAVVMGEYDSLNEAQTVASGVSVMGAGGYIWCDDSRYFVVGNVYKTKNEADSVLSNLTNTKYTPFIKEVVYEKVTLDIDNLTKEQQQVVSDSLAQIDDVFSRSYNYSIKYDKGEIVATVVSSELNTIKGDLTVVASKLDAINTVAVSNQNIYIKNALVSINAELETAVLKVIDGSSTNKDLKYLTTSIALIKQNLYKSLSK